MIRSLICVAVSVLLIGPAWAEDKEKKSAAEKTPAKSDTTTEATTPAKTESAAPQDARRRRVQNDANVHRGRLTKASMENGVLKLTLDGKEYEFAVGDRTRAMLRTAEKDGKQVVVGVQMSSEGRRAGSSSRPAKKRKAK